MITTLTDHRFTYKQGCYPRINSPIQNTSFLPKNSVKNSVCLKTCFYFLFFTNSYSIVKNSEKSTYKSPYSRSHTNSRLIGLIVITQRERLYKSVFLMQKRSCTRCCCLLGVRGVVHIWQRVFNQVVYRCWFWVYPNQEKKNLKRIA